jgi:hypothetical protein
MLKIKDKIKVDNIQMAKKDYLILKNMVQEGGGTEMISFNLFNKKEKYICANFMFYLICINMYVILLIQMLKNYINQLLQIIQSKSITIDDIEKLFGLIKGNQLSAKQYNENFIEPNIKKIQKIIKYIEKSNLLDIIRKTYSGMFGSANFNKDNIKIINYIIHEIEKKSMLKSLLLNNIKEICMDILGKMINIVNKLDTLKLEDNNIEDNIKNIEYHKILKLYYLVNTFGFDRMNTQYFTQLIYGVRKIEDVQMINAEMKPEPKINLQEYTRAEAQARDKRQEVLNHAINKAKRLEQAQRNVKDANTALAKAIEEENKIRAEYP